MLPLGDIWTGVCRAQPDEPWQPGDALQPLCNLGYARGHCARFPRQADAETGPDAKAGPDAVRFAISGDEGGAIRLYYVIERDHHPFAHGPLAFPRSGAAGPTQLPDGQARLLDRQAWAYVQSYLRRKREAGLPESPPSQQSSEQTVE